MQEAERALGEKQGSGKRLAQGHHCAPVWHCESVLLLALVGMIQWLARNNGSIGWKEVGWVDSVEGVNGGSCCWEFVRPSVVLTFRRVVRAALRRTATHPHPQQPPQGRLSSAHEPHLHSAPAAPALHALLSPLPAPANPRPLHSSLRPPAPQICSSLSREVDALQVSCGPALEALTKTADTANLEAVRRIKTQHARLVTRVTAAKEALEGLMGGWLRGRRTGWSQDVQGIDTGRG